MSFQPLHHVLGGLQSQYKRREPSGIQLVAECWVLVVGPVVAEQTQPMGVYRGVLKVATASAAWAQNLVFERQRLIEKLNQALPFEITDIRFSTAQWGQKPAIATFPGDAQQTALWNEHPSRVSSLPIPKPKSNQTQSAPDLKPSAEAKPDPTAAFEQWASQIRLRDRQHPLCPQCQSPTPPGELERWQICSLCVAQQWQETEGRRQKAEGSQPKS
jgi:predicted nucleic acid-binding Zn ribbon protein